MQQRCNCVRHALTPVDLTQSFDQPMKIVIVGGVAGGASAATRARRLSESAHIVLLERGPDVSFANCGLPYYIGGQIKDRSKLIVVTPARLRERFNLDVRTLSSALAIDRQRKVIRIRDLNEGRDYEESYDKLILSPGASPIRLEVAGADLPGIYPLRNLQDMDAIHRTLVEGAREVVVVGSGFIGLELVESLVNRGVHVTVVERQDQVLPPFDREMTAPLLDAMKAKGVELIFEDSVSSFEKAADGLIVRLQSGRALSAQLAVVGVGVRPESELAATADLELGVRGGIKVNAQLQTADPDIYAVGDAIESSDAISGQPIQAPLAGPANRQGRLAASHIFGQPVHWRGTQGTAIVGLFGRVAACTGASEKALRRSGQAYQSVYVHPANHAGYYPGAEGMTLKVLFAPDSGRILGAQAVGGEGVDKRIDVLSMALQARMTVFDLEEVELAYAPQFGSAKDPVNMAGFVAAGRFRGDHPQIDWKSYEAQADRESHLLLDVRTADEFKAGHIDGALNLPVDELRNRLAELPTGKPIVVYCQVGQRGYLATRILLQHGREVVNLSGGYKTYQQWKALTPSRNVLP
jgi:NADPH-dependent 2,4-dienoyl-CoA reductase/sulfur reductase-like enzyme/rhodanese-related sulfurtransferase